MAKSIIIVGTISNDTVRLYVEQEIKKMFNLTLTLAEIKQKANIYVEPTDEKIMAEDIAEYVLEMAKTNINFSGKLGIITDFECVSIMNQNKLLKTIEDATGDTLQIIVVSSIKKVIPTIISRAVTIDLRSEKLNYDCLENERSFYEQIVQTNTELNYLKENDEIKLSLIKMYQDALNNDYLSAYLIYTTRIKEYSKLLNQLVIRVILKSLMELKKYDLVKQVIDHESHFRYNLNERLQVEAMFVVVLKEQNE